MLSIGIVDDGVGFVPTLNKLRQTVSAEFTCIVANEFFPLGEQSAARLVSCGCKAVQTLADMGCNAVVLSSIALARCLKPISQTSFVALFGCDAPVLHASTYTASKVLLVGDAFALRSQTATGVISLPMPRFPLLAERGSERDIVSYISELCEPLNGQFDCIALANSSMNLYKHCFARVFPNVQLFDSLEGVARRIRKTYKKYPRDDSFCRVVTLGGEDITAKYSIFIY